MDEVEREIREKAKAIVQAETEKKPSAVEAFTQKLDFQLDTQKSYSEQAKDIVGLKATEKAIADEQLAKSVTDIKKAELLNHADANLKKEEAENKKADILLQEANYGVYNGVATYAGIKKPLPKKMQNILFSILSAAQIIFLIIIGIPISIVNISLDSVDSVIQKMRNVTKSARWIVFIAILGVFGWFSFLAIRSLFFKC